MPLTQFDNQHIVNPLDIPSQRIDRYICDDIIFCLKYKQYIDFNQFLALKSYSPSKPNRLSILFT